MNEDLPPWVYQPKTRPPAPPPPLRTTVPHVFLTRHTNGKSRPARKLAPISKRSPPVLSKDVHATIAAVIRQPAQVGSASSATTGHSHATQLDIVNPEVASNSSTACFLDIPPEVHCMIFDYLWTPIINICIMSARLSRTPCVIHPIFHVNHQIRLEATDSLKRNKSLTIALHASTDDVDFRKMASLLGDLDSKGDYFEEGGEGRKTLEVNLHLHFRDAYRQTRAPGGFAEFIACLAKLGLEAQYEYTFTDRDGVERVGDFARLMIVNRLLRLINAPQVISSDLAGTAEAIRKMQFPS